MSRRYEKVDDENYREIVEETIPLKMSDLQKAKADWELISSLTPQQIRFAIMHRNSPTIAIAEIARLTALITELGTLRAEAIPL